MFTEFDPLAPLLTAAELRGLGEAVSRIVNLADRTPDQITPLLWHRAHFGDHDPSGIDMTRDIQDRLQLFRCHATVRRIALNWHQVEEYSPPPNPAKETDSRYAQYRDEYGDESWELDALEPRVLAELVRDEVNAVIDSDAWDSAEHQEAGNRARLARVADALEAGDL